MGLTRFLVKLRIMLAGARIIYRTLTEGESCYPTVSVWQVIDKPDNIAHMAAHVDAHAQGRTDEAHLEHAITRGVMELLRLAHNQHIRK